MEREQEQRTILTSDNYVEYSLTERTRRRLEDAETLRTLCNHIANGGSMIDLCEVWDVRWSDVHEWVYRDEVRGKRFDMAVAAANEWVKQKVLGELRGIGFADVRGLYDENGRVKDVSEWPADLAKAVVSVDVEEARYDKDGEEIKGMVKKVKLADKLKSMEMLGKNLELFNTVTEHKGTLTLEGLIEQSMRPQEDEG